MSTMLAFAAVLTLTLVLSIRHMRSQARLRRRLQRVSLVKTPTQRAPTDAQPKVRRKVEHSILGQSGVALASWWPQSAVLRRRLEAADCSLAVADFLGLCVAWAVVVFGFLYFMLSWSAVPAFAGAVAGGTLAPHMVLKWIIKRRQRLFIGAFPEALDLIVRGIRSGLPVTEALEVTTREMSDAVRRPFERLCANIRIGLSLADALKAAGEGMPSQEFRFFAVSLVVQQETGGNLSEILHNLSNLIRRRHQMGLKIKAMSSEARASAMIIGGLPFISGTLIYLINPEYMGHLFSDPRGLLMIGVGGMSMGIGLLTMMKMVRFEI